MLGEKGKYASATENRRLVWSEIVWPLILEVNDTVFTQKQYQKKRDEVRAARGVDVMRLSRGLASLLQKGVVYRDKNLYGIHFRLIPYMRLRAQCDYATAMQEIQIG